MADNLTPREILVKYGQVMIDALRNSLEANGKAEGRGALQASITFQVKAFATNMVLEVSMNDYWKYVDSGVDGWEKSRGSQFKFKKSGKPIPESAMRAFIANNGITPKISKPKTDKVKSLKNKTVKKALKQMTKDKALSSLSWALGYNIKKKGIEKSNFVEEAKTDEIVLNLQRDISAAVGREIIVELKPFT